MALLKRFHQAIWQGLPRKLRRRVLFQVAAALAPRPSISASSKLPIIVAGVFRTASGLGQAARLCHDALKAEGLPVLGIDLTAALMQPRDNPAEFVFADGLLSRGSGTLIMHVNSPLMPLALLSLGHQYVRDKHIVGSWVWELPEMPPDWQRGTQFVHEIWVPSQFTTRAVQSIAGRRPVCVIPYPVAARSYPSMPFRRDSDHPFTVITIFNAASSFARKNPLATIAAFSRAFGDDRGVRLIVKVSNPSAFPQGHECILEAARRANNIVVTDTIASAREMALLYERSDVLVSLHRAEGFGLIIAEAMLHGLPVVATNWSGNVDFLTPETGIPVPYHLVQAEDPQGTYHYAEMKWAEANIEGAAEALCRLRADRALCNQLGSAAAQFGLEAWSAERYASAVRSRLSL